jgi:predicted nuclease of predicted toxin-antitoxin system
VRLLLDHHYSTAIAEQLRARGHDAQAALERGWQAEDDETLLELCAAEDRALLTNNVADFAAIAGRWAATGRQHAGLIFTSDQSLPRSKKTIGRFVACLDRLLSSSPESALRDQVRWLPPGSTA